VRITLGPGGHRTVAPTDDMTGAAHGTHVTARQFFANLPVRRRLLVAFGAPGPVCACRHADTL
jgi:DNA mismatch repair ATPase MutL